MHFDGLDFSGGANWAEGNNHTGLEGSCLDTTNWHCADTANLVNILEWQTKRFVRWSLGRGNGIKSVQKDGSLVPRHVLRSIDHVVSNPA